MVVVDVVTAVVVVVPVVVVFAVVTVVAVVVVVAVKVEVVVDLVVNVFGDLINNELTIDDEIEVAVLINGEFLTKTTLPTLGSFLTVLRVTIGNRKLNWYLLTLVIFQRYFTKVYLIH